MYDYTQDVVHRLIFQREHSASEIGLFPSQLSRVLTTLSPDDGNKCNFGSVVFVLEY